MIRYPPIYRRKIAVKEDIEKKKKVGRRVKAIEKLDRDKWKMLMKEKFDNEVKLDKEKVRKIVPPRFHIWLKVFEKAESERIPVRKPWDYIINLRKDFVPRKERTYLISREEKEKVREFVEKQLEKRYIRLSKSLQTSLVFFVGKKYEKKRMVQNYQYLNKKTVKNSYSLPLILDLIDTIDTKKVFTKMNLRWGYNNIQIKKGDEQKAVFTIYLRVYKPTVMFFGFTNLLATFQTVMNNILRDLINTRDIAAFIDNMLVKIEDENKHNEIVAEVLKRMEENNLYIKLEKCVWKVKEINFLGLVMEAKGVKMQEKKVTGVLEWPRPKTVKEVQKFLGLANYNRQFIKYFAKLAKPLHKLVRKDEKWNQGEEQEVAFKELKRVFTTKPVLVVSDLNKKMRVEVDILEYTTEGVLLMKCENEK